MTAAAAYVRVSTAQQRDKGLSLGAQRDDAAARCDVEGWTLVQIYEDAGISGAKGEADRPGLAQMVADAEEGRYGVLLVAAVDRLYRDLGEQERLLRRLDAAGVRVETFDGGLDRSTDEGILSAQVLGAAAQYERAKTARRTARGIVAAAQQGYWPGGPAPFGYRLLRETNAKHTTLEPDPEQVATVEQAARWLVDDGCSLAEVARRLNAHEHGTPTKQATGWTHRSVRRVLESRTLIGEHVVFARSDKRPTVRLSYEPLIPGERFDAIQIAIAGRSWTGTKAPARVYPLSGRLTGPCGESYNGTYRRDRDRRLYRCSGNSSRNQQRCGCPEWSHGTTLEQAVWDEVREMLCDPARLRRLAADTAAEANDGHAPTAETLADLDGRLERSRRSLAEQIPALLRGGLDPAAVQQAAAEMQAEIDTLERQRQQVVAALDAEDEQARRVDALERFAEQIPQALESMGDAEQAEMYEILGLRVEITRAPDLRADDPGQFALSGTLPQPLVEAWAGGWQTSQA